MFARRLEVVRRTITESRLQGFVVTSLPNIRYLTGFTGSNAILLLLPESGLIITDNRYKTQVAEEVSSVKRIAVQGSLVEKVSNVLNNNRRKRLGIEARSLTVATFRNLQRTLGKTTLVPTADVIERIRAFKDEDEISKIKRAAKITDRVFNKILAILKPGVRELEIAAEINYWHRHYGAQSEAFDPLVASGARGALPHGRASEKRIRESEMVTIDLGCTVEGYHCDMSRTVSLGKPPAEMKAVYETVLEAQRRSLDRALSGTPVRALDAIARTCIRRKGYGKFFCHSLGHGLGLEVHELPHVSSKSEEVLGDGSVITIEPGVYIPKFGGIRIEDDVVIRKNGNEVLNTAPKELIIV